MDEIDLAQIEREMCRLPEVSVARIVTDSAGRVSEVHIVAQQGKPPKQIARDVQSVALASFGLDIDRRVVSVVQLGNTGAIPDLEAGFELRPSIVAVTSEHAGLRTLVRVTLRNAGAEVVGFGEGSVASSARHRTIAVATLDALRQIDSAAECVEVDYAQIVRVGAQDVAVVTVVFVIPPAEQIVTGSAVVRAPHESEAIARALLDATNRRLGYVPSGDDEQ